MVWYHQYLGVHLQSGRCGKFNISHTKRNFYAVSMRHVTLFFYIVMALMILRCCICKSPIVFQLSCMPFMPCRLLTDQWRNETFAGIMSYVDYLVITNRKVSVPCHCHLIDLILDIWLCFVKVRFTDASS